MPVTEYGLSGIPVPHPMIKIFGMLQVGWRIFFQFHGKIHEYIELNKKNIVVDLANVDWMNSVGLGMLISALTTVKNSGGRLVLANIDKIESILTITRLISVLEHFESRDAAMKSFE